MYVTSKRYGAVILVVTLLLSVCALGCIGGDDEDVTLKVLHAGSLTGPMEGIKAAFEEDNPNVTVNLEPAGSISCVRKITDTGIEADVLGSADYTLIPSMMMPDYADWYAIFASNEMVLTYSDDSAYADEITQDNWHEILGREDVIWAFSNPNMDPCGYRTPMVIQLAEDYYGDDQIFENLIEADSAITCELVDGIYVITTPEDLASNTNRLTIRDKSVELVSMVLEGGLDYAWEYLSVAKQNDLNYITMPDEINLSAVRFTDNYNTVKVNTSDGGTQVGKPIVYGITIPKNAPHPDVAAEFLTYLLGELGQETFDALGQPPIVPAETNDLEAVPDILKDYVREM
ncbi:MAG TPA: tungstate ABC transporter substrate-binding protein WtpA [Methanomicrobia archaeon]|nr:tungstate ABC transporter substrate-binding protein WtpA [Methanomicrobia archaeon]